MSKRKEWQKVFEANEIWMVMPGEKGSQESYQRFMSALNKCLPPHANSEVIHKI